MKISTISKIVSRIQFTLYSLLAFFISVTILTYILLSSGITIAHVDLPSLKVDELYINLDKKLNLQVKKIDVTSSNTNKNSNSPNIHKYLNFILTNFHSIKIEELNIRGQKVTFSYKEDSEQELDNCIGLSNSDIQMTLYYQVYDDFIALNVPEVKQARDDLNASLKGVIDLNNNTGYAIIRAAVPNADEVNVYLKEDDTAVAFVSNDAKAKSIAPIVELFNLDENIVKWIVDYNQAKRYQLLHAQGIIEYKNPQTFHDSLFIHAKEEDLSYTFNKKLFPVRAETADVYFSKGILKIRPHMTTYSNHKLAEGSSVDIDFNNEHIMLTVDLNSTTTLDQKIVDIVSAYDIPLPLLQSGGTTRSHLSIDVDLTTEDATATGDFFIENSKLTLGNTQYKVKNAEIKLFHNLLDVKVETLDYQDILHSSVKGAMDLRKLTGDFYFGIKNIDLKLSKLNTLSLTDKDLAMHLKFSETSEKYTLPKANWSFGEYNMTTSATALTIPQKFTSVAHIDKLSLQIPSLASIDANGTLDLSHMSADVDLNLFDLNYTSEELSFSSKDRNIPLKLTYDENATVLASDSNRTFAINDSNLLVSPMVITLVDDYVTTSTTSIKLDDDFSSDISLHHILGTNSARLTLSDTQLFNEEFLYIEPRFNLFYERLDNAHHFDISKYKLRAKLDSKDVFTLDVKDMSKLHKHSIMMQKFDLKNGSSYLSFMPNRTDIDVTLKDFHPLLSKDGQDITTYSIKGSYIDEIASIRINDRLDFIYNDKGQITAKDIDFNLFPIHSYLKHINTNDEKSTLELSIKTKNCNVSLGDSKRKILSDSINVNATPAHIDAQLIHGYGSVLFQSLDNKFSVYGQGLDDTFMNSLFKFSRFKGGELSFIMKGSFDEFNGVIKIDETIMKDQTILNNTLAFFDTIPSLVTFSVPQYSTQGLKADEIYAYFHKKGTKVVIKDAKVISKQLTITAEGEADFEKENIDMLIQAKTEIGSTAKDIPVVGYVVFGEDSISTTVRVHGDIKNPTVESSIAKNILTAPYNIILRAISLPLKFLELFEDDENKSKE